MEPVFNVKIRRTTVKKRISFANVLDSMVENIETIRENFQFESTEQYLAFDQMAQEFLVRELMEEINKEN
jgi:hypothetical protein